MIFIGSSNHTIPVSVYLCQCLKFKKDYALNLGVIIDCDFTFDQYMNSVVRTAFYHVRNFSKVK